MYDNCNPDNCPVNARVDRMEKEFDRYQENSRKTHEEIFKRLNKVESDGAVTQSKLDTMDEKLDTILSWRDEQNNKPNKLIDNLKQNVINYIMLALMGLMLLKMGIGG